MSIESQLNSELKEAMRAQDKDRAGCIRQLKSKVQEATNAPGFTGAVTDQLYQQTIASYAKSLQKGIAELESAGERSQPLRDKYAAEITYLQQFLPKVKDEAATRQLVQDTIAALGVSDAKQAGRVMGAIMKDHKADVDAALVRRLVGEVLG